MNTRLLTILMLTAALAGCTDSPAPDTSDAAPDTVPDADVDTPADAPPLALFVADDQRVTRNATLSLSGTTNVPAIITLRSDDANATLPQAFEANGTWNASVGIDHGRTTITVLADDGRSVRQANVTLTRLSQITVQVTYRGDVGLEDRDDTFWLDIDAMPSAATGDYDECAQEHPGYPNIHDAMLAWTDATDHEVTYGDCGDFGVSVEAIEGHESPGFWCFSVNGEAADFGISLQRLHAGDVVAWDDCTLVLG